MPGFLIRNAELRSGRIADLRIDQGRIAALGRGLTAAPGATIIEAAGALLLPGLHDHHIHIAAAAAALASVRCGPPEVLNEAALARTLASPGTTWLRGIGYHESVTGRLIDRAWLDAINPARPIRIQHRTGRMWIFNTAGLDILLAAGPPPPGLDRETGRLFDNDAYLRRALSGSPPAFAAIGAQLAGHGVTGLTEISPGNDDGIAVHFAAEHASGALPQRITIAGRPELGAALPSNLRLGPVKLHLHEAELPDYEATLALIRAAHDQCRPVAVHCVTETELVFTLAALREAGTIQGDRIEHASVTPAHLLPEIAALALTVVVQPHFVAERGDAYRAAIPAGDWPDLYRLRSFEIAGIPLAGGSDAPFGGSNPWAAMHSATTRRTARGEFLTPEEALTPEAALSLYLADPADLTRTRGLAVGDPADLCLLAEPWAELRENLASAAIRATFIAGRLVHDRIHQPQP